MARRSNAGRSHRAVPSAAAKRSRISQAAEGGPRRDKRSLARDVHELSGGEKEATTEAQSLYSWPNLLAGGVLSALFIWSYWPTLCDLAHAWESEPDYSHGYLVLPIACYFLWARRDDLPSCEGRFAWGGLFLLIFSVAVRLAGALFYVDAVQAWSLPFWVAGACWLLGGRRLLWWALPAIGFLAFMIPLPFRAEHLLSHPLQRVATQLSCWMLQTLGQPAIREGNVVLLNELRLNVVEACSGLRIFVSVIALAYVYITLSRRPWWTKCFLVAAIVPVSLLVNAWRIALTGLLNVYVSGEAAHKFSHDMAGWLMLPLAAAALAAVVWYADRLIIKHEPISPRDLLLRGAGSNSP